MIFALAYFTLFVLFVVGLRVWAVNQALSYMHELDAKQESVLDR